MINIELINNDYLIEMAKISKKYASKEFGDFGDFIYFSKKNSSHGPRIKFYGGDRATYKTENCPTMKFDINGNCELEKADWMTKKNCPNAFDKNSFSFEVKSNSFINLNICVYGSYEVCGVNNPVNIHTSIITINHLVVSFLVILILYGFSFANFLFSFAFSPLLDTIASAINAIMYSPI